MLRLGYSVLSSSLFTAVLPAMQHTCQTCCFATKASPPYLKDAAKSPAGGKTGRPSTKPKKDPIQKRPPSGYTLFIKDRAAARTGQGTAAGMVKLLAQEWKSMTDGQKAPYNQQAAELKSQLLQEREQAKGPKKPGGAYMVYFQEQYPLMSKRGLKVTEAAREIGKLWKALPEDEKARRKAAAQQEIAAWKEAKP